MGCFSWMFADTNNRKALKIGKEAYIPRPEGFGTVLHEANYGGHGIFCGNDVYEMVADWNREFLSKNPEFELPSHSLEQGRRVVISDFPWYNLYADLSLNTEELEERLKCQDGLPNHCREYRWIGIEIACYDEDNAALPYPIKVCRTHCRYEDVPASNGDEDQGCY